MERNNYTYFQMLKSRFFHPTEKVRYISRVNLHRDALLRKSDNASNKTSLTLYKKIGHVIFFPGDVV